MSWEEIMGMMEKISQLQTILEMKLSSPTVTEIISRKRKYCDKNFNVTTLHNPVLENKIDKTLLQATLLAKLNDLKLSTTLTPIYNNMKESLEECSEYVKTEKEKYEYAIFLLNLVFKIEEMTEIELKEDISFENNSYAKMSEFCNELYQVIPIVTKYKGNIEKIDEHFANKILTYWNQLSILEKNNILTEGICLSYDRNSFIFVSQMQRIYKIQGQYRIPNNKNIIHLVKDVELLLKMTLINYYYESEPEVLYRDFSSLIEKEKKKEK